MNIKPVSFDIPKAPTINPNPPAEKPATPPTGRELGL
jgi:hypothetical protein